MPTSNVRFVLHGDLPLLEAAGLAERREIVERSPSAAEVEPVPAVKPVAASSEAPRPEPGSDQQRR